MIEVLVATLVMGLVIASYNNFAGVIYVLVAIECGSLLNWLIVTVAFLCFYMFYSAVRAVTS